MRLPISILLYLISFTTFISAQTNLGHLQRNWWHTDGIVNDLAIDSINNLLYVAGNFTSFCSPRSNAAVINKSDWNTSFDMPIPGSTVTDAVPDGKGGWFFCGDFRKIGGVNYNGLGRVDAQGKLYPIDSLAHINEAKKIIFDSKRNELLILHDKGVRVLNLIDKSVNDSKFNISHIPMGCSQCHRPILRDMLLHDDKFYVSGEFKVNNKIRNISVFDAASGAELDSSYNFGYGVLKMKIYESELWIAKSDFYRDITILKLRKDDLTVISESPSFRSQINDFTVYNNKVLVGGRFTEYQSKPQLHLALLDANTWEIDSTFPQSNGHINHVNIIEGKYYIHGSFTEIAGQESKSNAFIDIQNHQLVPPIRDILGSAKILNESNNRRFIGGQFPSLECIENKFLGILDINTGEPVSFPISLNGQVKKLHFQDETLVFQGDFTAVNGVSSNGIAIYKANSQLLQTINLPTGDQPSDFVLSENGESLFVSTQFDLSAAEKKSRIFKVDLSNNQIQIVADTFNGEIKSLAIMDSTLWIGGKYVKYFNSDTLHGLVGLNLTNLSLRKTQIKRSDLDLKKIRVHNNWLYCFGDVMELTTNFVRFSAEKDTVERWGPTSIYQNWSVRNFEIVYPYVYTILKEISASHYYVDRFHFIRRYHIETGEMVDEFFKLYDSQSLNSFLTAIARIIHHQGKYFVAGSFKTIDEESRFGLAVFDENGSAIYPHEYFIASTSYFEVEGNKLYPNPAKNSFQFEYDSPRNMPYQILDINGRILQQSNCNQSPCNISIERLPTGFYMLRTVEKAYKFLKVD